MSCGYGSICVGCNKCNKSKVVTIKKRICFKCGHEPPADARFCPLCNHKLPPPFPPPPGKPQQSS